MTTIGRLDREFGARLSLAKGELLSHSAGGTVVRQLGAAYIGDIFEVPATPIALTDGLPAFETFVADADGDLTATGEDIELVELWQAAADRMSQRVAAALQDAGVTIVGPGYLTASAVPLDQVTHEPHFDDDLIDETQGINVVAIASTHGGTRVTDSPITLPAARSGSQLSLPESLKHQFEAGAHHRTESEPGRIVVFGQFGQLHSGPILADARPTELRTLFVLRYQTRPASSGAAVTTGRAPGRRTRRRRI